MAFRIEFPHCSSPGLVALRGLESQVQYPHQSVREQRDFKAKGDATAVRRTTEQRVDGFMKMYFARLSAVFVMTLTIFPSRADDTATSPAHFRATGAYDSSIHSITAGQPSPVTSSQGDTWDLAWTQQGTIYSFSDDTSGFNKAADGNILFNEITGDDPTKLDGKTLNPMTDYGHGGFKLADGCTWKSSGFMALDGTLYCLVARHLYGGDGAPYIDHDKRQAAHGSSFIKSTDNGKTWTRSMQENYDHPMFPRSRFAVPYFVQYGQDGHEAWADRSDKYVYALSNNGFWDNGDYMIRGRCLRSKMPDLNEADWQFYTNGDGAADGAWSSNVYDAKSVLTNPNHLGMTRAVYLPKHQCYLMIGWYYPEGSGKLDVGDGEPAPAHVCTNWDFYVAPHP